MVIRSAAAIMGPMLMPMVPGRMAGQLCVPDGLHGETVEQAVFHHHPGTGKTLFARLEDQHGRAIEAPGFSQVTCRADQHGHMPVMAAAMHQAALAGFPGELVTLDHGQGVHVRPQAEGGTGVALASDDSHHPRLADPFVYLIDATQHQRLFHTRRAV